MIPGTTQILRIANIADSGVFLTDEGGASAFLPRFFIQGNEIQIGDEIQAFIYHDGGELKATTEIPYAEVGEYAVMTCVQSLPSGAFVNWGIIKDLFVPYKQQKGKMEEGRRYLVYVYNDPATGLVTGTTKFKRNATYADLPLKAGESVQLIIAGESELGWNVVVNKKYLGLIYASDVYKKLFPLSEESGYIKTIREDGKIDVTLQPEGYENIDEYKQIILKKLQENYGLLYLSDASAPAEIKEELQMSKKNFKKALGGLYKDGKVDIADDKIRLK